MGPAGFCQEGATGLAALGNIVVSLWCTPATVGLGAALAVRSRFMRRLRGSREKSTVSRAGPSGLTVPAHSWNTHCVLGLVLRPGAVATSSGVVGLRGLLGRDGPCLQAGCGA